jgi:TolA-binding protein
VAPVVAPRPTVDAAGLFTQASRARARGDHAEAIRGYRDLIGRYPTAPESRLARATLGRMLLDDGDPAGALAELDAYLREGDSTLREEAMASRAVALGRLGRPADEAAAWSALLDRYPESIHGARARSRLVELGTR